MITRLKTILELLLLMQIKIQLKETSRQVLNSSSKSSSICSSSNNYNKNRLNSFILKMAIWELWWLIMLSSSSSNSSMHIKLEWFCSSRSSSSSSSKLTILQLEAATVILTLINMYKTNYWSKRWHLMKGWILTHRLHRVNNWLDCRHLLQFWTS